MKRNCIPFIACTLLAVPAQAALVVYDGFDYTPSGLAGQNGGSGFSGAWANLETSGTGFTVQADGLVYSNLLVTGGRIQAQALVNGGKSRVQRDLSANAAGQIYGSYLYRRNSTIAETTVAGLMIGNPYEIDIDSTISIYPDEWYQDVGVRVEANKGTWSGGRLRVGETFLVLFSSNLNDGLQTATMWVLNEAQFDTFKAGGLTEAELNAASVGTGSSDVWAKATAEGEDVVLDATNNLKFMAYGGWGPPSGSSPPEGILVSFDELRLSQTSFDEVVPLIPTTTSLLLLADHGIIQGAGDYEIGTTATLTVTANPGYLFAGWSGDADGIANPLSVLMDADKTITANFTPDTNDDDDDGLTNYQEIVEYGTDPAKQDTDGDGVKDSVDGRPLDPAETLDTDHDGIGDNADPDDDGDGLSDVDEINTYGTNPKRADSDGDGLSDSDELQIHMTNPNVADTDGDGLSDGAEFLTHHTNPKIGDTDGDGFLDGYEVLTGKLPLDAADHPALVAEARTAIEFTFPSALGKTYRIEGSPDLTTWTTVEDSIAGNGGVIQRFYSTRDKPKGFLRVEEDGP